VSALAVPFGSLYGQGFVRVAVGVPHVRVADPRANVESTLALAREASQRRAILAVFPELGLSCYSADDLFHQQALLDAVQDALAHLVEASTDLACALVVGAKDGCSTARL
jgi:NAD+ synthase (glutamine-hydrolysing)